MSNKTIIRLITTFTAMAWTAIAVAASPDLTVKRTPRCPGGEIPDGGFTVKNNESDMYYRVQVLGTTYGQKGASICTCNVDLTFEIAPTEYRSAIGCEFPTQACDWTVPECNTGYHCSISIGGAYVLAWSTDGTTWHDYGNPPTIWPSIGSEGCDPVSSYCSCD